MSSVFSVFIVKMRPGRKPAGADIAYNLTLRHATPIFSLFIKLLHMGIQSADIAAMTENNGIAIPTLGTTEDNFAIAGSFYWRTAGRRVIHTFVCAQGIKYRVPAIGIEI